MPRLSTKTHGVLDYAVGALFLVLPFLLGFAWGAETTTLQAVGGLVLVYSALTDYERGLLRRIPVAVHLWLDAGLGVALAVSPWLFEFDERAWIPHVAGGALMVVTAVLTPTIPGDERRRAG